MGGGSSEMLPALALQVSTEGSEWNYQPGYFPIQIAGHWIPRIIWPEKNISIPELLYSQYFPNDYAVSRANVQFSALGELYYDSGIIGVTMGMIAYGYIARLAWQGLLRNQQSAFAHMLYSPFLLLFMYLLRGDTALILSLALFVYLPLLLAKALLATGTRSLRDVRTAANKSPVASHQ